MVASRTDHVSRTLAPAPLRKRTQVPPILGRSPRFFGGDAPISGFRSLILGDQVSDFRRVYTYETPVGTRCWPCSGRYLLCAQLYQTRNANTLVDSVRIPASQTTQDAALCRLFRMLPRPHEIGLRRYRNQRNHTDGAASTDIVRFGDQLHRCRDLLEHAVVDGPTGVRAGRVATQRARIHSRQRGRWRPG
jgi:hypothetical protein